MTNTTNTQIQLKYTFEAKNFNQATDVEYFTVLSFPDIESYSIQAKFYAIKASCIIHKVFNSIKTHYNEGPLTEKMIERFKKEYENLPGWQKVWEYVKDLLNNMYNYIYSEKNMSMYEMRNRAKDCWTTGESDKKQIDNTEKPQAV